MSARSPISPVQFSIRFANVHPTVVSYRGTPQATMDLLAGNVDFGCNQIVNILQHLNAGKVKAYAVTSDKRSPMLPNVPTTAEAGMPEFNLTVWFGLSAPQGTPAQPSKN